MDSLIAQIKVRSSLMNNYAMFSYINITPVCHIGLTKAMYGNVFKKSICHQTRRGLGTAVLLPSKLRPIIKPEDCPIIKQEEATFLLYWLPEDNIRLQHHIQPSTDVM